MKKTVSATVVAAVVALTAVATTQRMSASSHREALAILNEPCADNTDTFAWVSNGLHDKLYLIMDFNPLHEPGQGNQGLRACDGYRYEFHIAKGASLKDKVVYRVEFKKRLSPEAAPSPTDPLGGGNELLWQLTGGTETMKVSRIMSDGSGSGRGEWRDREDEDDDADGDVEVLGDNLPVLPNNHGPQTDRLVYGLGAFKGYDSGDPTSREVGLYDQTFVDRFIHPLGNGGRVIAGQFDDPYQLDEKGIFDLVNLGRGDLGGIPGARRGPIEDVITGLKGSGKFVQVGRNALPLFNAGLVGTQRQTLYLHSSPQHDVTNFGADILFPVLVRDAEALGIYKALGVPAATVATLKGPRADIINAINLGRPIPIADGFTADVITLDAAIDSSFPNGRRLGGGVQPNMHQVNVNSVLISLIVAGNPAAGLARGVEVNDKDFNPQFPFLAPAHQGLLQGHGGINVPTEPTPPPPGGSR